MLASLHNKIGRQLQVLLFSESSVGVMLFSGVLYSSVRTALQGTVVLSLYQNIFGLNCTFTWKQ